jgi:hypothetical protein
MLRDLSVYADARMVMDLGREQKACPCSDRALVNREQAGESRQPGWTRREACPWSRDGGSTAACDAGGGAAA